MTITNKAVKAMTMTSRQIMRGVRPMKRAWVLAAACIIMAGPVTAADDASEDIKFGQFTLPHHQGGWTLNLDNRGRLFVQNAPNDPDYSTWKYWGLAYNDKKPMTHISARAAVKGYDAANKLVGIALVFGDPGSRAVALEIRPNGGVQILGSDGPDTWSTLCGSMTSSDLADNKLHQYEFANTGTSLSVSIDGQNSMSCDGSYGTFGRAGLMLVGPRGTMQNAVVAAVSDMRVE
jgi:hypothetical protein